MINLNHAKGTNQMREITSFDELLKVSKALSSKLRLTLIQLVAQKNGININELADKLNVTSSAMTAHIHQLEDAGLIRVEKTSGKRGTQKRCYLDDCQFFINPTFQAAEDDSYVVDLPIGSFVNHKVFPTCGMATREHIIGQWDYPCYFDDPERLNANILWMGHGFVEYRFPNYLKANSKPVEIQITQELSSEAPGYNENWPSDIHFTFNNTPLGIWTSPGDFGSKHGLFTPDWWISGLNQYGILVPLIIRQNGTYIGGEKISDVTIDDFNITSSSELVYRIDAPTNNDNRGGMTLFGKGFGNYNQGLRFKMFYQSL